MVYARGYKRARAGRYRFRRFARRRRVSRRKTYKPRKAFYKFRTRAGGGYTGRRVFNRKRPRSESLPEWAQRQINEINRAWQESGKYLRLGSAVASGDVGQMLQAASEFTNPDPPEGLPAPTSRPALGYVPPPSTDEEAIM